MSLKAVERTIKLIGLLQKEYPQAKIALCYRNPLELLVATILSAQSTDITVNKVTPGIFKKYKTARDYAAAAKVLVEKYKGKIPKTMDEILELPGVARKTGNIVLYNAYGVIAGIPVDTHVRRLSRRLGLTKQEDPEKIKQDLMKLVPHNFWGNFSYLLIDHGRIICQAKKPKCPACVVKELCPSYKVFYHNLFKG